MSGAAPGASRAAGRAGEVAPIRLMIVDDSPIARAVLARMLSAHADFEVVAFAANAAEAIDALGAVGVDIVLLDVEMPGTSGLEALPEILRRGRGARVLIVSSLAEEGAAAAVEALALGAADALPKPGSGTFAGRFAEVLAERLRRIGRAAQPAGAAPAAPVSLRPMPERRPACLAIGASTGGIHAIGEFLGALPPRIGMPILVTQHLPAVFMPFFARQIAAASGREAAVAEEGDLLRPDRILVAPGDAHLTLARAGDAAAVRLDRDPAPSGCLPSVDPMLASLAQVYGAAGLGVVLSGMGRDGLVGGGALAASGGALLVQDRSSSAVWGMPRALAEAGLASAVLAPADLARRLGERLGAASCR